jgi:hypothetical protein
MYSIKRKWFRRLGPNASYPMQSTHTLGHDLVDVARVASAPRDTRTATHSPRRPRSRSLRQETKRKQRKTKSRSRSRQTRRDAPLRPRDFLPTDSDEVNLNFKVEWSKRKKAPPSDRDGIRGWLPRCLCLCLSLSFQCSQQCTRHSAMRTPQPHSSTEELRQRQRQSSLRSARSLSPILWTKIEIELTASVRDPSSILISN